MVRAAEVASALSAFSGLRLLLLVYARKVGPDRRMTPFLVILGQRTIGFCIRPLTATHRANGAIVGTCAPLSDLPSQFIAIYESMAKW